MNYMRRLAVPGLSNCRDLGGFACHGGVTRFGVFLRSEAPCGLDESGIQALKDYGLGESFDLRGAEETAWRPSALEQALPYRHIPLKGGAETFDKKNLPQGEFSWDKVYIKRALEFPHWFRDAVTACCETDNMVLFHCTTGKDRTGILTCCLLGAVGVSREDIAADYCLSEVYLQDMFAAMRDGSLTIREGPSNFKPYVFHTPYTAMAKFYDFLTETHGSVKGFLLDIGVTEQSLEKLRKKFVQE
ncbi:MAG: tyrosine-protein phosphatase [Oscillospiraceae bacterium]|nr:tyrosine-protein phosphatase [Oscillospiraceae bacterium]